MRIAILTISTSAAAGQREDTAGPAAAAWAHAQHATVTDTRTVPDDTLAIVRQLITWADTDAADLIFTTGGTGLSPTDVTPEATRAVVERETQAIADHLRTVTAANFPRAALSRATAGIRNKTLIINLPGSPTAVTEYLAALEPIAAHAIAILRGTPTDHTSAKPAKTEDIP
jgi:molybdopterin adenylyltransferase